MTLTILGMTGINVNAAAPQAGDLIKMDGLSTVYFLGNDGKRYVYPTSSVYFSWHKDFSGVVTVSASELQSYPLGSNITVRPGTKLVKITTDPSVYAVEANGTLRKIASEADAIAIYGANWAKRVIDVPDAFFTNYTIGTALTSGQIPAGTLVKNANSGAIYLYDGTNYRSIATEAAFNANRYDFANVITISNAITAGGTAITGAESLNYDAQNSTNNNNVVTTSGVTVSVSANTAAASSVIGGQALADLASFNFTASNDGQAVIKTIKLKRIGISSDSSLDNVYLYDGVTRLTDGATFSNGYVSFSNGTGIISIPAGQTKTLTVKGDVAVGATGNIGVAINAASDIISSAAAITGSFPISGNLMSPTAASDLSKVALTLNPVAATAKAGNTNTIIWSNTANVTSKAVDFKYIAFKQIGSINASDLANLSLYVDGTKVGTATLNNNDLAFNLATPVRLNTGTHTIELKADIITGSSRTFSFSLQTAANAVFTDTNYNVNVAPTSSLGFGGTTVTISQGTLSISADSTFNDTQIVKTATNATLSRFKIKAFGEDVKVNTFGISVVTNGTTSATTTEKINDLAIVVNGSQVGSSKSIAVVTGTPATTAASFGTTNLFTIPAGTEVVVEIKGSLSLDTNTAMKDIKVNISGITAQGVTSYGSISGAATTANNTLSIVSGSMTVAKNTNTQDQYVSKNVQKVKIGSYILSAGSAEGVNISNVRVNFTSTSTADLNNVSNLYISENTTPVNPQTNNDFNTNLTIDKSQSKTIDVYADLGDLANGIKVQTSLVVTYKTTVTQTFGTSAETLGQVMTLATATLDSVSNVSDTPASGFVLGGNTATAAKLKFVATNGAATINELYFTVNSSIDAISQITVDGVTAPVIGGKVVMTGLNTVIAAGLQGVNVEVKAAYNNVTSAGQGGVATGNTVNLTLTGMKYTVNGAQSTSGTLAVNTNSMKLVSALPTVVDASSYGSNANLVPSGKSEVMRFSVTATGNNPINMKQISLTPYFDYTIPAATSSIKIYDASDLSNVLSTSTAVFTTSGTRSNVAFTNDVTVSAGTTRTFVVYADNTGTASTTGNYFRMDMVNPGWLWNDSTITGTIDGTYVKEFTGTTFKK